MRLNTSFPLRSRTFKVLPLLDFIRQFRKNMLNTSGLIGVEGFIYVVALKKPPLAPSLQIFFLKITFGSFLKNLILALFMSSEIATGREELNALASSKAAQDALRTALEKMRVESMHQFFSLLTNKRHSWLWIRLKGFVRKWASRYRHRQLSLLEVHFSLELLTALLAVGVLSPRAH